MMRVHAVRAHAERKIHELEAAGMIAKNDYRKLRFAQARFVIGVSSNELLALVNDCVSSGR